jgi:hypothetical protein
MPTPRRPPKRKRVAKEKKLLPVGDVKVTYERVAPRVPEGKTIHPRRPLPPVPESSESLAEDEATSGPGDEAGSPKKPI